MFDQATHALTFFEAFSSNEDALCDIKNFDHQQYAAELLYELDTFKEGYLLPNYFLTLLKYKCLKQDSDGVIQIYRFFDDNMLPGKTFVAIRQLTLIEKIMERKISSRFIQNQLDDETLVFQIQTVLEMCKQIVFANELTFFDRTMLNYTTPLRQMEQYSSDFSNTDKLMAAISDLKRVFITLLHASGLCWSRWLDARNDKIWLNTHKKDIFHRF
jgi:hypothetical protein